MNLYIAMGLLGAFLLGVIVHALWCMCTGEEIDELEDFTDLDSDGSGRMKLNETYPDLWPDK